jgi:hypothetical protein
MIQYRSVTLTDRKAGKQIDKQACRKQGKWYKVPWAGRQAGSHTDGKTGWQDDGQTDEKGLDLQT